MKFSGKQVINMKKIGTTKDGVQKKAQSKRIGNIGASNWETEIIDKLKKNAQPGRRFACVRVTPLKCRLSKRSTILVDRFCFTCFSATWMKLFKKYMKRVMSLILLKCNVPDK